MPDNILFIVFGILTVIGLTIGGLGIYFAMKNARTNGSEMGMVFWAMTALAGLTFGGMCLAYFIIPIILNHL